MDSSLYIPSQWVLEEVFSCAFNLENVDCFTSYYIKNVNTIPKFKVRSLLRFNILLKLFGRLCWSHDWLLALSVIMYFNDNICYSYKCLQKIVCPHKKTYKQVREYKNRLSVKVSTSLRQYFKTFKDARNRFLGSLKGFQIWALGCHTIYQLSLLVFLLSVYQIQGIRSRGK